MSDAQVERFTECSSLHQMMLIVFSKILHLRQYYEDCYFFDYTIHGVTTPIIDVTNPFVNYLIADSIKGAASAADQRYLRNVQLIFKLLNDKPESFVERYVIVFDEDNNPELVSPDRRASLSPVPDQHWNREDIMQMVSAVDQICGDLASFPDDEPKKGGLQVMFRLDYNRNCPEGYHAPHFNRSNYTRLKFSNLLPAVPVKNPPPLRSLSDKDKKVRSVLSVQSLLTRGNSLPPPTQQSVNRLMNATRTDTSIFSPYRKSRDRSKETSQAPPLRQKSLRPRQPSKVELIEDEDEEELEEEEVSDEKDDEGGESDEDEEDEEPEEIETARGEKDEKERRKRSIDRDDEEDTKKARSTSSSLSPVERMNREYDPNATIMSSSMDVGNNTLLQKTLTSPPSPEMLSMTASSPTEQEEARKKEDDDDEDVEGSQEDDPNKTIASEHSVGSDGGGDFFIN